VRVHLNGLGERIPVEALPNATLDDQAQVSIALADGDVFEKAPYVTLGYNHFEVICIGGSGARGGDLGSQFSGSEASSYGGGGGGGGLHIVSGLLVALADECDVVVGEQGADGDDGSDNYSWQGGYIAPGDGGDGGFSSFDGDFCVASGGKGGSATPRRTRNVFGSNVSWRPGGDGGEGGIGGQSTAGGGAAGAVVVYEPEAGESQTDPGAWSENNGSDGTWDGTIGAGGGGGAGGTFIDTTPPPTLHSAPG
jgi:hypothetical protein